MLLRTGRWATEPLLLEAGVILGLLDELESGRVLRLRREPPWLLSSMLNFGGGLCPQLLFAEADWLFARGQE